MSGVPGAPDTTVAVTLPLFQPTQILHLESSSMNSIIFYSMAILLLIEHFNVLLILIKNN